MFHFPEEITPSLFLQDYWQQKPLLFRQALEFEEPVITSQELIELSRNEEVESRLVIKESDDYQLIHGPQDKDRLNVLNDRTNWTLLVQSVNLWSSKVAELIEHIDFLPKWRFDDIMISYATNEAGVGPHTDEYDVFLLQLSGQRQWRIGNVNTPLTPVDSESGLKLVEPFHADLDVLLNPGDMIYVPPSVPHEGISRGEGMTLSIGFRSPTLSEFSMMLGEQLVNDDSYYRDSELTDTLNPNEISESAMTQAENWFRTGIKINAIRTAFGRLQTLPKQELVLDMPEQEAFDYLKQGGVLTADPAARIAYHVIQSEILLFVNGEEITLAADAINIIRMFCSIQQIDLTKISTYIEDENTIKILNYLTDVGYLGIDNT